MRIKNYILPLIFFGFIFISIFSNLIYFNKIIKIILLILVPGIIIIKNKNIFNIKYIMLLFLLGLLAYNGNLSESILYFSLLFSSIIYFRYGLLNSISIPSYSYKLIIYLIVIINIITIILFELTNNNYINICDLYELLNKDCSEGISRFSIGNALELPVLFSIALFVSIEKSKRNLINIIFLIINLLATIISGSRAALIISLVGIIILYSKHMYLISISTALLLINFDGLNNVIERLFNNDGGSFDERIFIYKMVFDKLFAYEIFIGNGFHSSYLLMMELFGRQRSIESLILEILYEFGIFGSIIIILNLLHGVKLNYKKNLVLYFYAMTITVFLVFFMPIFNFLPLVIFFLGLLLSGCAKIK